MESLFRLVSGDYRGFVMIWEMEDIKEELVTLERRVKSLPKNGCVRALFILTLFLSHLEAASTYNKLTKHASQGNQGARGYFS